MRLIPFVQSTSVRGQSILVVRREDEPEDSMPPTLSMQMPSDIAWKIKAALEADAFLTDQFYEIAAAYRHGINPGDVTPEQRQACKTWVFKVAYGGNPANNA